MICAGVRPPFLSFPREGGRDQLVRKEMGENFELLSARGEGTS